MTHRQRPRVVITGIGVVSPNGIGVDAFTAALREGRSGISRLDTIDVAGLRSSVAGQAREFDPLSAVDSVDARRVPRMAPMAIAASREAMTRANLHIDPQDIAAQRQIGVCLGTGGGGLAFVEDQYRAFFLEGKGSPFSITAGTHGNLSSELSIALKLRGPSHVISTGCASSTDAIGYAALQIRAGIASAMIVGGADSPIARGILTGFEKMRVVSTRKWDRPEQSSRPFDRDRDGFVLGEGAWMFVLESLDHALARNAPILAEVAGHGSTCDAYHRVQIAPDIAEPVRAIEAALAEANLSKDDIGYVNLHGTGTSLNDKMETAAMKKAFGARSADIPMSTTKSMIGHPQGAGGAAGVAATILSMLGRFIHPTINLDNADPDCDLDYVPNASREKSFDVALCNCIAFGSKNSALVIKRF